MTFWFAAAIEKARDALLTAGASISPDRPTGNDIYESLCATEEARLALIKAMDEWNIANPSRDVDGPE